MPGERFRPNPGTFRLNKDDKDGEGFNMPYSAYLPSSYELVWGWLDKGTG